MKTSSPFQRGHCAQIFHLLAGVSLLTYSAQAGETLYNGIVLPDAWPPKPDTFPREEPVIPPWLKSPPKVVPIDVGRQLFVDDFLIEPTDLQRTFHQPVWHPATPVLKPETAWENHRNLPFAAPFSDGVWYDPNKKIFKMWYLGGTGVFFCYATSHDGLQWDRPKLDEYRKDTNILRIEPIQRDSSTVWMDLDDPDPARRYKMFYFRAGLHMRVSADGIKWSADLGSPGPSSDRNTMFYNPFRKAWVFSIRSSRKDVGRCRFYAESREFGVPNQWSRIDDLSRWACADALDLKQFGAGEGMLPDLYNLDAVAYESVMLGMFTVHARVATDARPKLNQVSLGYSRDGFHWHRPDRRPFLSASEDPQAWNYGNVQSAGGGCVVMGDQLFFYCSGRNSHQPKDDGSGGSTGLAVLRRDGFASLDAGPEGGIVTTRPVTYSGKHLFVNVNAPEGELRAEILDEAGHVIAPFTREASVPVHADKTRQRVTWTGARDLAAIAGKVVRFRFHLKRGELYAFWVSPDESGSSNGYVAAGGPEFTGHRDTGGASRDR